MQHEHGVRRPLEVRPDLQQAARLALPLEEREEAHRRAARDAAQPAAARAVRADLADGLLAVEDVRVGAADEEQVDQLLGAVAVWRDQRGGKVGVALHLREDTGEEGVNHYEGGVTPL